jgi:hypothetical protein
LYRNDIQKSGNHVIIQSKWITMQRIELMSSHAIGTKPFILSMKRMSCYRILDQLGAVWKPHMQHHSAVPCMNASQTREKNGSSMCECQSDKQEKMARTTWLGSYPIPCNLMLARFITRLKLNLACTSCSFNMVKRIVIMS